MTFQRSIVGHFRPSSRSSHSFALLSCLLVTVILTCGCSSAPPASTSLLHAPYQLSPDGFIRYRLPVGWFDVTADSQSTDLSVWLVRDDYAGSLIVREVHVDAATKRGLGAAELLQIARLTAGLETGIKPGFLVHEPEITTLNGKEAISYDVEYRETGDRMTTILLEAGGRVYVISALVNGTSRAGIGKDIYSVLQSFVAALRW